MANKKRQSKFHLIVQFSWNSPVRAQRAYAMGRGQGEVQRVPVGVLLGSMTDVKRTSRPPGSNVYCRCPFHMVIEASGETWIYEQ